MINRIGSVSREDARPVLKEQERDEQGRFGSGSGADKLGDKAPDHEVIAHYMGGKAPADIGKLTGHSTNEVHDIIRAHLSRRL